MTSKFRRFFGSQAKIYRQIAEEYDMVYFGQLQQHDDEHRIVRGMTASMNHVDDHYCVGTVDSYDIILLSRTDLIYHPNSKHNEHYSWAVMQIDLHRQIELPHLILEGRRHRQMFYRQLNYKFPKLRLVESEMSRFTEAFRKSYNIYYQLDKHQECINLLSPQLTAMISTHFSNFDFEIETDSLYVYVPAEKISYKVLENMLRAGLWLVRELEQQNEIENSASIQTESSEIK